MLCSLFHKKKAFLISGRLFLFVGSFYLVGKLKDLIFTDGIF